MGILTRLLNGGGEFPAAYLRIEECRGPSTPWTLRVREASTPLRMTQYKEVEDREAESYLLGFDAPNRSAEAINPKPAMALGIV